MNDFAKEWEKKRLEQASPLLDAVDNKNSVAANYIIQSIRSLKFNKKDVTIENVIDELKSTAFDLSLLDTKEYYFMFENAINYYIGYENLTSEERSDIKLYSRKKYTELYHNTKPHK